jgi:CTP synthase (UTP-ammonia lyase)
MCACHGFGQRSVQGHVTANPRLPHSIQVPLFRVCIECQTAERGTCRERCGSDTVQLVRFHRRTITRHLGRVEGQGKLDDNTYH